LQINHQLLSEVSQTFSNRDRLFWVVGGAVSGKTTICTILSERFGIPIYDMDAHIYGAYHARFKADRHPANFEWANSPNGLAWLLEMSWDEFNSFNQAALVEYLDLLVEDIQSNDPTGPLLIDGGIWHPGLLTQALPAHQIVCVTRRHPVSSEIWEENEERRGMKKMIDQLKTPVNAWQAFLEFDTKITQTISEECLASNIAICTRDEKDAPAEFADRVAEALKLEKLIS
jgi:hypothetical protein